jgi:MtrB/PioB family decaheme-associated outer membrane protein
MKHLIISVALVTLALPALCQEDFQVGEITFGVNQLDSDTTSSKFLEYRDIPQGAVAPFLHFKGKSGDFRYDMSGSDISQEDQVYGLKLENRNVRLKLDYTGTPHSFGNGGLTLLSSVSETEWLLTDTLQQSFQTQIEALPSRNYDTVFPIVNPSIQEGRSDIDVKLNRNRTKVSFDVTPENKDYGLGVHYFHERRSGTRGNNGTAFGFNNVVETAEPVRYITQDFGVDAKFRGDWGVGRVGFNYNDFSDKFDTFLWDNPFRGEDSTSGNAYLGPYSTTAGSKQGLASLPPSSNALTVMGGATFMFGPKTRLTADVAIGNWKQNEQTFIPYTINTAVLTPEGEPAISAALPASSLDGKIDTQSISGFFTTGAGENLRLNARYRYYNNDNKTPQIHFEEGYVRFDAVFEEIPRISVPYSFKDNVLDVYATYDVGSRATLEAGYKYNKRERTFRESRETTENGFRIALDVRGSQGFLARGLYELANRDYDEYDAIRAEEESFLDPGAPANLTVLRRYDQSKRDLQRIGGTIQLAPGEGKLFLLASYIKTKQEFDDAPVPVVVEPTMDNPLGLMKSDYETFTVEADFTPTDRATFYGFYSRENIDDYQIGRQSGGSLNLDPATNWTSTVADQVDSIGCGGTFVLVPGKWTFDLFSRWQEVDGDNSFTQSGENPEGIPAYDDTKLFYLSGNLKYQLARAWAIALGGFYEDYEIDDAQTGQGNLLNYMPGSFFLNANNGNYQAWVSYAMLTYSWQ